MPKPGTMGRSVSWLLHDEYGYARRELYKVQVRGEGGRHLPTPCIASSTPSHSHNERPARALATGPAVQGKYWPIFEVLQRICAQRGAPSPIAKTGRAQE